MKILYNRKTGNIKYIELDIQIQTISKHGFWAKYVGIKDSPFFLVEPISLFISPYKEFKGMATEDDDEPKIRKGQKFKLILKEI